MTPSYGPSIEHFLIVFGFIALSYICHTLLNWILAHK